MGVQGNDERNNMMKDGAEWVHSDTLGLVRFKSGWFIVADATNAWHSVTCICTRWLKERCPSEL